MSSQYREEDEEIKSDLYDDPAHARQVYQDLSIEYGHRLAKMQAEIAKAKSQFPPYWDDAKGQPAKMPMYQHNVSTGRFTHALDQIGLNTRMFFPTQKGSATLLESKILNYGFTDNTDVVNSFDKQTYLDAAFDNLIKLSTWARKEHLKMSSDYDTYGVGMYYKPDPSSYKYQALDITTVKFPIGSSTSSIDDWEYLFVEHEYTYHELVRAYTKSSPRWNQEALADIVRTFDNSILRSEHKTTPQSSVEAVKAGVSPHSSQTAPAKFEVVSVYWKNTSGTISMSTFVPSSYNNYTDKYLYEYPNIAKNFSDIFSAFIFDESSHDIRASRGWGVRIYTLCHAFERAFCKFLDHLDYSATLFLSVDPAEMHKKVVNFGSVTIGKIDQITGIPSVLQHIITSLSYLDSQIDKALFVQGLNRTELLGSSKGTSEELNNTILTMEGRVHKHYNHRFNEQYTDHWRKTLSSILDICSKQSELTRHPEVETQFKDYLMARGFTDEELMRDDTSNQNYNLPSHWIITARASDGGAITPSVPHVIRMLTPFMTSLPESGFKYLLGRVLSDAFGDPEILDKLLPNNDLAKPSSEIDAQNAEIQAQVLTSQRSEFDYDFSTSQEINPETTDGNKFIVFPAVRTQDHVIFLNTFFNRIDKAQEELSRREIGRTTLHIYLYNLVSTAQNHVELLRSDEIRGNRPEALELYERFGQYFNLLRQVESQANADRAKKMDAYETRIQQEAQDDPKRIEAMAKLETARAKQAEVQLKYDTNNFTKAKDVASNRRAEEAHIVDQRLKIKALLTPTNTPTQGGPGRLSTSDQASNE